MIGNHELRGLHRFQNWALGCRPLQRSSDCISDQGSELAATTPINRFPI